jgi:hypothetical protein
MEIFQYLTVTTVPPRWREEQRREAEEKSLGNHGSSGLGPSFTPTTLTLGSALLVLVVAAPPDVAVCSLRLLGV